VVEEAMAPLLAGHPDVDDLFVVRLRPWRRRLFDLSTARETVAFFRRLADYSADVAIDFMGNHKAGALAALSLAQRSIGADRAGRREPSSAVWIGERVAPRGAHAVERACRCSSRSCRRPARRLRGRECCASRHRRPPPGRPRAATRCPPPPRRAGNKRYPAAGWAAAATAPRAARRRPRSPPRRRGALAGPWHAASAGAATVVRRPACRVAALARNASLVVGGDTGSLHLAHALRAPVLMVMGPTDPIRHGPYGAPERAVAHRLPCSFCYKRYAEPKACLLDIPPREIAERAAALLAV
jgi:ADP-heptose:LPS heptosyltransferase